MIRIGLDIDGVFADFNTSFLRLLHHQTGRILGGCGDLREANNTGRHYPTTWNWMAAYGYHPEELKRAWAVVDEPHNGWWNTLEPIHGHARTHAILYDLTHNRYVEPYFVTNRTGDFARKQTHDWLKRHGAFGPQVLVTADKGLVAKALKLHYLIDDYHQNIELVATESPDTKLALYEAAYNAAWRQQGSMYRPKDVVMVQPTALALAGWLQDVGALPRELVLPS